CVLLYHAPLSQLGRERLAIMRETTDGFVIAEKDLELRGPGEMLGVRQTGLLQFKVADLMRDADLLPAVPAGAQTRLARGPQHVAPLLARWLRHGQQYGQVSHFAAWGLGKSRRWPIGLADDRLGSGCCNR